MTYFQSISCGHFEVFQGRMPTGMEWQEWRGQDWRGREWQSLSSQEPGNKPSAHLCSPLRSDVVQDEGVKQHPGQGSRLPLAQQIPYVSPRTAWLLRPGSRAFSPSTGTERLEGSTSPSLRTGSRNWTFHLYWGLGRSRAACSCRTW